MCRVKGRQPRARTLVLSLFCGVYGSYLNYATMLTGLLFSFSDGCMSVIYDRSADQRVE